MTAKTMLIDNVTGAQRLNPHAGQLVLMGRSVARANGPGSLARLCLERSGQTESALLAFSTCAWIGIMKEHQNR
jgi:hypothetical protein